MYLQKRRVKGVEYIYVVRSVRRPDRKYPVQETVRSYGRLEDRLREDPRFVEKLEASLREPDAKIIAELSCGRDRKERSVLIGSLPIEAVLQKTGILKAFDGFQGRAEYETAEIARDLICERIICPSSKLASYAALSESRLTKAGYGIHDVYRALDDIGAGLDTAVGRFAKITRVGRKTSIVDYDTTNFYFETETSDAPGGLRQYGISKEHRPNPIVQMGLFVDQDGYPVAVNVNPGNTAENKTAVPTQKLMAGQGISSYVYCADAGIGCGAIKAYNNMPGRRYVVAQSIKRMPESTMEWALSDEGWKTAGGKRVKSRKDCPKGSFLWKEDVFMLKVKERKFAERIIVLYSEATKAWQDAVLESQVGRAAKRIGQGFPENPNSPDRLIRVTRVTDSGEVAENEVKALDGRKIGDEEKFHGFYAIATNILAHEMKATGVIGINAGRWKVERYFRTMKSTVDTRPVFLQGDNEIKAHLLLCTTAVYVMMVMAADLKRTGIEATPGQIQEALKGMFATERKAGYELGDMKSDPAIARIRKGIESAYGLEQLEKEAIETSQMKKLIKKCRGK